MLGCIQSEGIAREFEIVEEKVIPILNRCEAEIQVVSRLIDGKRMLDIACLSNLCFGADSYPCTRILLLVLDLERDTSTAIVVPVSRPKGYGTDSTRNAIGVFINTNQQKKS